MNGQHGNWPTHARTTQTAHSRQRTQRSEWQDEWMGSMYVGSHTHAPRRRHTRGKRTQRSEWWMARILEVIIIMKKQRSQWDIYQNSRQRANWVTWVLVGLARTIYIRCTYGISGREITKYTVIHGAYLYIRLWPTLGTKYVYWFTKSRGTKHTLTHNLISYVHIWHLWNGHKRVLHTLQRL